MAGNHRKRGGERWVGIIGGNFAYYICNCNFCVLVFNGMQDWYLFELGFTYLLLAAYAI